MPLNVMATLRFVEPFAGSKQRARTLIARSPGFGAPSTVWAPGPAWGVRYVRGPGCDGGAG